MTQETDVFIAYDSADREAVEPIAKALSGLGWSVFWDPEILPGQIWDDVIEEHIEAAKCLVVLWSEESVRSRNVRAEARYGLDHGKLVPARIGKAEPPLVFREIQTANLVDWKGNTRLREFQRLVTAIAAQSGHPKTSPSYLKEIRKRSRIDVAAGLRENGFRKSPRSDDRYYHAELPDLRAIFLKTKIRIERRIDRKWTLMEIFDLVKYGRKAVDLAKKQSLEMTSAAHS